MSFGKAIITPALVLALFLGQAAAFWQYGHLFVAKIAYDKLESTAEGKAALAKANAVLETYKNAHPEMTNDEGDYPFVECATFADEIKAKGGSWQSGWHFVDTPYLDKGGSIDDYPGFVMDPDSVDKAIPHVMNWLMKSGDYQSSFVYTTMEQKLASLPEDQRESYALRLMIHYIGDIHQPLHATSRVDPSYPKGDAGGNFVSIPTKNGAKNLHSVWDSVLYLYTANPNMPFNPSDWSSLGQETQDMLNEFTVSNSEWQNVDVEQWSAESFELSKSNVYTGVTAGKALSSEYVSTNQAAIKKQIVLGGLRLSYVIQHIFGNNSSPQQRQESFLQ